MSANNQHPNLLFSSYHNYLDGASGAALTTRAQLLALSRAGWRVRTLCGSFFDGGQRAEEAFYNTARRLRLRVTREKYEATFDGKSRSFQLFRFNDEGIESVFFLSDADDAYYPQHILPRSSGKIFLQLLARELQTSRPDVYASYGGYWLAVKAAEYAGAVGARRVFLLHNMSYRKVELFRHFDKVVVPSEFARRRYSETLDFDSIVLPPLLDETRVIADRRDGDYVVFINPALEKGRNFFLGIARDLGRVRADIPLLAIESRARANAFGRAPFVRELRNLNVAEWVEDVRSIYASTRLLLFPSLCDETFGRVALEAAFNGIPVLCSDRGATRELLEELGGSECVLPIPRRFQPDSANYPEANETKPWLDAIIELWDNPKRVRELGARMQTQAKAYNYEVVCRRTLDLFQSLL